MNNERVSSSAPKRLVSSPAPKRLVDITNSGLTGPPSIRKRTSAAATRAAEPGPPHRVDAEAIKELPKTAAQAAAPAEPPARTEAAAPTRWPRPVGAAVAWCRDAIVRSSELPPEPLADSLALGLVGGLWPIPGTVEVTSLAAAHAIHADMLVVTLATTIMYPLHFLLFFCRVSRKRNTDRQEKSPDDTLEGRQPSLGADALNERPKTLPAIICGNQETDSGE